MGKSSDGRLVWNHSTHIPKLIPVLEKLLRVGDIRTITPGEIKTTRSHIPKLQIKVSVPIRGGFKLIARKAKAVQEVFILTTLDQASLETAIAQVLETSRT
ncbi:MAG: metal-binding protein [Leptolyngbyaceae cyanobacterium SM1_1_3]|nr:metal-binding protein [Leptolyngbyaceae cyanobacterium SM1_1_3]NJN04615.1 metal-binding protein [Leptolyngbyaceae cyanobacterium RM1_1_2]NJO11033.1 metal-binding protein [Leptolyngbyaceae cyanobacterium SL_1_1]